jgi:heme a synthase
MTETPSTAPTPRAVRVWLYALAALVVAMVIVGGMTRLTDSGLSITEWRPVTGSIPPLSESAWATEFAKYPSTPQYHLKNRGMSLEAFKQIYWWEWIHRFLGRLIGLAFFAPFVWFLVRGQLPRRMLPGLVGIFALGGLQGAIGWWMVASGLVDRVSVAPYRLAVHLTLALVIFAALLWVARTAAGRPAAPVPGRISATAWLILVLTFVQVALGGLVAGLDAGRTFTTWPLIDGGIVPPLDSLLVMQPAWTNFFENPLTVQFDHRMVAYLLLAVAAWHAFDARSIGGQTARRAAVLLLVIVVQAVIGIATLLHAAPLGWAIAHQLGAVGVIAHAVMNAHAFSGSARAAVLALPARVRSA